MLCSPRVGLEPTIRRGELTAARVFAQQRFANPFASLAGFELSLARHRLGARWILLGMNHPPRPRNLLRVLRERAVRVVVLRDPAIEVGGLADIRLTGRFGPQDVDVKRQKATPSGGLR